MFHPPELPFYTLNEEEGNKKLKLRLRHILNPNIPSCKPEYLETLDIFKIRTKRGNDIVALELNDDLGVNVMVYDYSGYGQSTGKPSEKDTYADIEAAYGCLVDKYGEEVILYGRSIGSGPTIDLATRLPKLRGVVLESGITSVFRMMKWWTCGMESNFGLIRSTSMNHCGEGGKHNDLDKYPQFIEHLKKFVSDMEIESGYRRTSQRSRRGPASSEEGQSSTKSFNVDQPEEQARNVNGKRFISVGLLNCFKPASTKQVVHDSQK
ncbi:hypothetical protein ACLB2K_076881 [Fragaria x ananassa]